MMHQRWLACAWAVLSCCLGACAQGPAVMGQRLLPGRQGRVLDAGLHPAGGASCAELAWTAAQWQAHFDGTTVQAQLFCKTTDVDNRPARPCRSTFGLWVDNVAQQDLTLVGGEPPWTTLVQGLKPGPHDIVLRRKSEAQMGTACLCGVRVPGGQLLPPPPLRRRSLLVLGDSISAGYGNLCAGVKAGDPMGRQDGTRTYGALAADALHADVRIMAWSGIGLWRNGDGSMVDTLPDRWRRAAQGFAPEGLDGVVVNLGTNDFRRPDLDGSAFVAAYVAFVRDLAAAYPRAHIFLAVGPMLQDAAAKVGERPQPPGARTQALALVHTTLAELQRQAPTAHEAKIFFERVHVLPFETQDGTLGFGCDYHPNSATHEQMARTLQKALGDVLGWS